jgi:hypothetical protein
MNETVHDAECRILTGTESARIQEIYKNAIPPIAVARAIAFAVEQAAGVDINEIVLPDGAGNLPPTGIHADDALAAANPSALRL